MIDLDARSQMKQLDGTDKRRLPSRLTSAPIYDSISCCSTHRPSSAPNLVGRVLWIPCSALLLAFVFTIFMANQSQARGNNFAAVASVDSAPVTLDDDLGLHLRQTTTDTRTVSEILSDTAQSDADPATESITETEALNESLSAPISPDEASTEDESSADATSDDESVPSAQPLEGTIIANRTDWTVTFFVEGELRRVEPQRSAGVVLLRSTSGLNLFTCEADADKESEDCFWEPYEINENGFYEVLKSAAENGTQKLILERATAPPSGQVWVQNRTELGELIFWNDDLITLAPTSLREFDLGTEPVASFYMRSCIVQGEDFVCEWQPQEIASGVYYSMEEVTNSTSQPDSYFSSIQLFPIESSDGTLLEAPTDALCTLLVPSLNIRSGPGLEYLVISQAFASATDDVVVRVVGRNELGTWLATANDVIEGGWIVYSPELLSCTEDLGELPIAEVTDGRLAPVQAQAEVDEQPAETAEGEEGAETESGEEGEEGSEESDEEKPPPGQSLLIIENVFEADIRFTLNEEIDLKPGDKVNLVVNAGRVQFSASSPWRGGMAGNAEFLIEPDETKRMFLYFVTDPKDSDKWLMRYE